MQISLVTLTILKNIDSGAKQAWKQWIKMADFNNTPVQVACWYVDGNFEVALVWH